MIAAPFVSRAQTTLNNSSPYHYYQTGLELFDKGKYGEAQKAFGEYIRLSTQQSEQQGNRGNDQNLKVVDAEYYQGICALYLFNPDAEMQIERFIAAHPQHPRALNAYYELGLFYYAKKDYDKTIEYLGQIDPEQLSLEQTIEMKFKLGYAYFSKQEFEKASPLFDDLKRTNHPYTSASNYYAGYINYKLEKYDQAITDLRKAEKDPAYQNEVPYLIANIYYKQGRYDELLAYTEPLLAGTETTTSEANNNSKKPGRVSGRVSGRKPTQAGNGTTTPAPGKGLKNSDDLFLLTAEAYYRKGNYAKAAPYFLQYAEANRTKRSPDVQYRIAFSYYQTGDYAKAAENFKSIAASRDTLGQYAAYYMGLSYLKTDNKPFALTAFDQARKGKNKELQRDAAFDYVKVMYDIGTMNAQAIAELKEFLKTYPNSPYESEANELLGEAYLSSSNYTEAITHIESLKSRTPRTEAAYQRVTYNQGVASFNAERFPDAVTYFDKSLKSSKDPQLVLAANFWKGEAYSAQRQYENAVNSYAAVFRKTDEGLKSNTEDFALKSRYGIGYAYYNQKMYDRALPHFREYVNRLQNAINKQNYLDGLVRLADCYYVTKNYDDAVRTYDQAIAQNTVDKDYAYYQKGVIYRLQGKDAEARKSLDNLSQYPQSRYADGAMFEKAQLSFEKGDYNAAITQYSQLIDRRPNSTFVPFALQRRAIAYSNLQNYDKSIADYRRILENYPNHKVANSALLGMQEALNNAGRSEEFTGVLAQYKQSNPDDNSLENVEFEAAKNLYFNEKYEKAVQALQTYLRNYPNSGLSYDAKFYLAEAYYRLNNRAEAAKYYQMVVTDNRSSSVARAITRLAELELAAKNYPNAIRYYLTSLSSARNKKEQSASWLGLMDAYYGLAAQQPEKYDSVRYYADEIISKGGATVNAQNRAMLYRGKAYYAQQKYDQAVDEFLRTVNSAKDENGAEAQYLMGDALYNQNKFKESLDALFEWNSQFSSFEKWRGKVFLLIADNYVGLNEVFQAKATLNSIIEKSPDKAAVEEAKAKLKKLEEKQ